MKIRNFAGSLAVAACLAVTAPPARAEVVVVVSSKNSTSALSKAQVAQIFLAKSTAFPGGGKAEPIDQGGAARGEFYDKVTGKDAAQLKAYWSQLTFTGKAKAPKQVGGDADVRKAVAGSESAIGYLSSSAVDGSVKVVFKP